MMPDDTRPGPPAALGDAEKIARIIEAIDFLLPRPEIIHDPDLIPTDPPTYSAPWYRPAPVDPMRGDPEWGKDDPEALRAAGAKAVATALAQIAEEGLLSWRRSTREIAALALQWLDADGDDPGDLAAFIGLRPRRGQSFAMVRKLSERDDVLREVVLMSRWAEMSPMQAARSIRAAFEDYEGRGWLIDKARPGRPQGEPRSHWWRILRLGLHHPLPNIQTMAGMVETARR